MLEWVLSRSRVVMALSTRVGAVTVEGRDGAQQQLATAVPAQQQQRAFLLADVLLAEPDVRVGLRHHVQVHGLGPLGQVLRDEAGAR